MKTYPCSFFPGPTMIDDDVLRLGLVNYGSADVEPEFAKLYDNCVINLQKLYATENDVVIMTGEGMLVLWSALKSCLVKGDKVLCISTGVFGDGMKSMAESIGCNVKLVSFPYNSSYQDYDLIEHEIKSFKPKMITAVQCETPSGIMNDMSVIGKLKKMYDVPLLYVDAVSALGGAPVNVDENNIDLCLGGSQKVLGNPPNSCFTTVSPTAWDIIEKVKYAGYDALLDFRNAFKMGKFPYTLSWVNMAQLHLASEKLLTEGLDNVYARHETCAAMVRDCLKQKGIKLFPMSEEYSASTVTAAYVPDGFSWEEWNNTLRSKGVVCGGSLGQLSGKVFRVGHMGNQANLDNIKILCGSL